MVDPAQSYYRGIGYRAGLDFQNVSRADPVPNRTPDASCLDSTQAWFCRDLWVRSARDAVEEGNRVNNIDGHHLTGKLWARREVEEEETPVIAQREDVKVHVGEAEEVNDGANRPQAAKLKKTDPDANVGSDYDAMPDEEGGEEVPPAEFNKLSIPNSVFRPARILVNPRCPTTYAGVRHTQLARELFGGEVDASDGDGASAASAGGKYVLDDWEGAPESFVCQEQRYVLLFVVVEIEIYCLIGKRGVGRQRRRSGDLGSRFMTSCNNYSSRDSLFFFQTKQLRVLNISMMCIFNSKYVKKKQT